MGKSMVFVTWDGESDPFHWIEQDVIPQFNWGLFDYSGKAPVPPGFTGAFLSKATECKGDVIQHIGAYLLSIADEPDYVGLFDDDIAISVSGIHQLLRIGQLSDLTAFQASLTHDSYFDHRQFLHKPGYRLQLIDWVEIMAPIYRYDLFVMLLQHIEGNISGTGIDCYLIPTLQRIIGHAQTAVVHQVTMTHTRPVRSGKRIFSNGKTCLDEMSDMQAYCRSLVAAHPNGSLFDRYFKQQILERKFYNGIPLSHKIKRLPRLFRNLYLFCLNESYR